jgi:hypothetical protein
MSVMARGYVWYVLYLKKVRMVRIVLYKKYVRIMHTLFLGYMKGTLVYYTSGLFIANYETVER